MINYKNLANELEVALNLEAASEEYDRVFLVTVDAADFKPSIREDGERSVTHYINALYHPFPSALSAISGLTIVQMSAQVDFLCDIYASGKDGIELTEAEDLRAFLDKFVQEHNGVSSSGVLTYYSLTTAGTATVQTSDFGETIVFSLNVYYTYVEGGYTSGDISLKIDGKTIPVTAMTRTYTKTPETALTDGQTRGKAVATQGVIGIDFSCPLTTDNDDIFLGELTADLNTYHLVALRHKTTLTAVKMMIVNVSDTTEPPKIVGVNVSMLEAHEGTCVPSASVLSGATVKYSHAVTSGTYTVDDILLRIGSGTSLKYPALIDWGDGSDYEIATSGSTAHTFSDYSTVRLMEVK